MTARDDRETDRGKKRRSPSGREDQDRKIKNENQRKNPGLKKKKSEEKNQDQNHEKNLSSAKKGMIRQLEKRLRKKLRQWKLEKHTRNNSLEIIL